MCLFKHLLFFTTLLGTSRPGSAPHSANVQALLNSLLKVLFSLPSWYLFDIGPVSNLYLALDDIYHPLGLWRRHTSPDLLSGGCRQQPRTCPRPQVPAARLFFVILWVSVFSSTRGNPEVGAVITTASRLLADKTLDNPLWTIHLSLDNYICMVPRTSILTAVTLLPHSIPPVITFMCGVYYHVNNLCFNNWPEHDASPLPFPSAVLCFKWFVWHVGCWNGC